MSIQTPNPLTLDVQVIEFQQKILEHLETLQDKHHKDNIKWFQKLIANSHNNVKTEDIDLGILYNLTYLDIITAKLLNIDSRKIIKVEIVKKYIKKLWEDNSQPKEILESNILSNASSRNFIEIVLRLSDYTDINQSTPSIQTEDTLYQIELQTIEENIPDIEMAQNIIQNQLEDTDNSIQMEDITQKVLGKDINYVPHYATRNRK